MSVLDRPDTYARLFLALPVPAATQAKLAQVATEHYAKHMKLVPPDRWHLTLFFLGEIKNHGQFIGRLKQPLPQSFVPTVSITHIGRGEKRDQLWAYVQPTAGLLALREAVRERLVKIHFPLPADRRTFLPHVRLGTFFPAVRGIGLADTACATAFAVREAHLYKSTLTHEGSTYTIEATIPFSAAA